MSPHATRRTAQLHPTAPILAVPGSVAPRSATPGAGFRATLARRSTLRLRRAGITVVSGLALAGAALVLAAPAGAAAAAAPATGWVRLAHLSPDTPAVDASLTAFGASGARIQLKDVKYGDVSAYQRVPAGTYAASMVMTGADPGSTPVITKTVQVGAGGAFTVAAVGRNADLTSTVLTDDLTPPAAGDAKVRLLQASVSARSVDVTAVGGPAIATGAAFGSSTGYAAVPAGAWDLKVKDTTGAVPDGTSRVDLPGGSVNTLFVLDEGQGKVRIKAVADSSGVAAMPTGGVQTGGGALAHSSTAPVLPVVVAGLTGLGALGALRVRRSRVAA